MVEVLQSIVQPNESDIKSHLEHLFAWTREEYPRGLIEIAYGNPAPNKAQLFNTREDGINDAVQFAAARSRAGDNVYVGVNPRKPETPNGERADATAVEIAAWQFADIDSIEALEGLRKRLRPLPPSLSVTTGTTPHRRPHLYWQLEEPVRNLEQWTERQRGLAANLEGDPVIDPPRIMRLAGTVNFPPQRKLQKGYAVECITLRAEFADEREPYSPDQVKVAFPPPERGAVATTATAEGETTLSAMRRTNIEDLLEACKRDDNWHNNMIRLVAHLAAIGRSSVEILAMADAITLPGYSAAQTRDEMARALHSARVKFGYAEPESEPVEQTEEAGEFAPTAWEPIDPKAIPPREWLFGDILARNFVSVLVAPPGVGKSTLTIEVGLSVALKKQLGPWKPHEQANVWIFNNEDPRDELDRRISAFLIHEDIHPEEVAGKLFVDSGEERHLTVAKYDEKGEVTRLPVVSSMIEHIRKNKIGLLIVDPFLETHSVNENSNNDISIVARLYREIAQKTGCAVWLIHHTRKTPAGTINSAPGDSEAGRGASSLGGVARFTATLFGMSEKDAKSIGIEEEDRHRFVRFDDGKANLKLKTGEGVWWKKESVSLDNAQGFRPADSVGVLEWVNIEELRNDKEDRDLKAWEIMGPALLANMNGQNSMTTSAAGRALERAGEKAGMKGWRTIERYLQSFLSVPRRVGVFEVKYVQEKRGNGSHWVQKKEVQACG